MLNICLHNYSDKQSFARSNPNLLEEQLFK